MVNVALLVEDTTPGSEQRSTELWSMDGSRVPQNLRGVKKTKRGGNDVTLAAPGIEERLIIRPLHIKAANSS